MKCCLCENDIDVQGTWEGGHNAEPAATGRCCSTCNYTVVLPLRIKEIFPRSDDKAIADLCQEIKETEHH